ncbi:YtxH domain-containing protein [Anaeromyxobacter paludicola]|nr:YtxH domain-containing protein [Anaeromyxobacter paludicola]
MDWKSLKKLRNMDRDDVLDMMGLERSTPTGDFFTGLGLFAVGMLVGAGLGLLFAPKRGEEIRAQMGEAWRNRREHADEFAHQIGMETSPGPTAGKMQ